MTRFVLVLWLLTLSLTAQAANISFLDPLENVDAPLGTGNLGINSATALGGQITVASLGGNLFRRADRGLGVAAGEPDEIDGAEILRITVNGSSPAVINSFQVRSLFAITPPEQGTATFFLNGGLVSTVTFTGTEIFGSSNGVVIHTFGAPLIFDRIDFEAIGTSNYAVAGLNVDVPEPSTWELLGSALLVVGMAGLRTRRAASVGRYVCTCRFHSAWKTRSGIAPGSNPV